MKFVSYGNLKNSIQGLNAKIIVRIVENLYAKKGQIVIKKRLQRDLTFTSIFICIYTLRLSLYEIFNICICISIRIH